MNGARAPYLRIHHPRAIAINPIPNTAKITICKIRAGRFETSSGPLSPTRTP